eukprot:2418457-Rhodomonas_salina.1
MLPTLIRVMLQRYNSCPVTPRPYPRHTTVLDYYGQRVDAFLPCDFPTLSASRSPDLPTLSTPHTNTCSCDVTTHCTGHDPLPLSTSHPTAPAPVT